MGGFIYRGSSRHHFLDYWFRSYWYDSLQLYRNRNNVPQSGGMSNYAQYTHGSLLGFIAAWANWVSLVTIIPIEAVSAVQYMSSWPWDWAKPMGALMKDGSISTIGFICRLHHYRNLLTFKLLVS